MPPGRLGVMSPNSIFHSPGNGPPSLCRVFICPFIPSCIKVFCIIKLFRLWLNAGDPGAGEIVEAHRYLALSCRMLIPFTFALSAL